jgi:raffinose/stachyose/melibiose transport system permease protein
MASQSSAISAHPARVQNRDRLGRDLNLAVTVTAFLLPASLIFTVFLIFPIVQAAYFSLFKWNGLGPVENFIGLENYLRLFQDKVFRGALFHNLLIIFLSLGVQLPISLGLALMVWRKLPGRIFFRTVFFLPYVLSEVITGIIWLFIYHPEFGLVTTLFQSLLPGLTKTAWLGDPQTALNAIFVVLCWKYFGFYLILYLAGLQQIPAELEEAARIDGATDVQVLRYVILPLLGSILRLTIYLSILGSLQIFVLVWVMTQGGPVQSSNTMATYLFKFGFQRFALGYGSTVAVVLFLIGLGFSVAYQRAVLQQDYTGGVG